MWNNFSVEWAIRLIAFRREFLEQVLADPKWSERFEAAETTEQLIEVIKAYCKEKKLSIREVGLNPM